MLEGKKKKKALYKYSYEDKEKFSCAALNPIFKAFPNVNQRPLYWFN